MEFVRPRNTDHIKRITDDTEVHQKIKDRAKLAGIQIKKELIKALIAALLFVGSLAWRDAINHIIEVYYPLNKDAIGMKFLFAAMLTLIAVLMTVLVFRQDVQTN